MGAPFWTEEEKEYFVKVIIPRSKYPNGMFDDDGLDFKDLAPMMQEELDRRGVSKRRYTGEMLFQHWYQKCSPRSENRGEADALPSTNPRAIPSPRKYGTKATTRYRGVTFPPLPRTPLYVNSATQTQKVIVTEVPEADDGNGEVDVNHEFGGLAFTPGEKRSFEAYTKDAYNEGNLAFSSMSPPPKRSFAARPDTQVSSKTRNVKSRLDPDDFFNRFFDRGLKRSKLSFESPTRSLAPTRSPIGSATSMQDEARYSSSRSTTPISVGDLPSNQRTIIGSPASEEIGNKPTQFRHRAPSRKFNAPKRASSGRGNNGTYETQTQATYLGLDDPMEKAPLHDHSPTKSTLRPALSQKPYISFGDRPPLPNFRKRLPQQQEPENTNASSSVTFGPSASSPEAQPISRIIPARRIDKPDHNSSTGPSPSPSVSVLATNTAPAIASAPTSPEAHVVPEASGGEKSVRILKAKPALFNRLNNQAGTRGMKNRLHCQKK